LLLVLCTGNPFFKAADMMVMLPSMGLAMIIFMRRRLLIDKFLIFFILAYLLVQIGQMFKFNFLPITTYMGLYVRILFAYFTIRILGRNFPAYFTQLLYVLSIISFVFYVPSLIIPGIESFFISLAPIFRPSLVGDSLAYAPNIIIHVFQPGYDPVRNCGLFWEPTAFAGFLLIALIFHIIEKKTVADKKGIVLILALISTLSTTGLIALGYFLMAFVANKVKPIYRLILIPTFIVVIFISFTTMDLLGKKISSQFSVSTPFSTTRFESATLDLKDWSENPILGLGRHQYTRYKGETSHFMTHRNNGLSDYLVTYGVLIFIMYFSLIYFSFYRLCRTNNDPARIAVHCLILILIIGFSEGFFTLPFFYGLTLVHLIYREPAGVNSPASVSPIPDSIV
jgi:hypothetical protein